MFCTSMNMYNCGLLECEQLIMDYLVCGLLPELLNVENKLL